MPTISDRISYHSLFTDYLPRGAFYVVKEWRDFQFAGILEEHLPLTRNDLKEIRERNNVGYDVFWTANAVKEERDSSTHDEDNLYWINSVYTELDIDSTKECVFEEDFKRREAKKAELAGHILFADPQPSLVIESRNSFHLYWFTNCELDDFRKIQQGIYEKWKQHGADPAVKNSLRLLRVPGFYNHKNGEKFLCQIRMELCCRNDDGSFKYWSTQELLDAFPVQIIQNIYVSTTEPKEINYKLPKLFVNIKDIFRIVNELPIIESFERINGTRLTGGDKFTLLLPPRSGKVQIRKDGKPTPNWLNIEKNMIFSNNIKGFCVLSDFAEYYGLGAAEIAQEFKIIFKNEWEMKK